MLTTTNLLAAVGILIAVVLALRGRQPVVFLQGERVSATAWAIGLFVVMLAGILARYYWDLLGRGKTLADTDIVDLIRPVFVSPLVFFPIWSQTSGAPKGIPTLLVAFQSGFFWQAVFEKASRGS